MARTIVHQPAAIFPMYNPARVILQATAEEEYVDLSVLVEAEPVSQHRREFFIMAEPLTDNFGEPITDNSGWPIPIAGELLAVFDLGALARNFLSNALVEVNAVENGQEGHVRSFVDRRLCVPFVASFIGVGQFPFTAVNAALSPGVAEASYLQYNDKFLIQLPKLYYYQGYTDKSTVSALIAGSGAKVIDFMPVVGSTRHDLSDITEATSVVVSTLIPARADLASIDLKIGAALKHSLLVENRCTPEVPFYVRWVNGIGGREHWMFTRRQRETQEVNDLVTHEADVDSNADKGKKPRQISLSVERTAIFGAEGLSTIEFKVLRDMPISPVVEWFDDEIQKWRVITVKSGGSSYDRESSSHKVEFEFVLPAKALQF